MAARVALLDDVASNLVPARALGMHAVLVDDDPAPAIVAVGCLAGLG